jgi:hypothetical protein
MISTAAVEHGDIKQQGAASGSTVRRRYERSSTRAGSRSRTWMEQTDRARGWSPDHGRAAMSVDERAETALREHGRDRRGTADENLDEMGAHVGVRR